MLIICCKQCNYHLKISEIIGHFSGEAYDYFIKNSHKKNIADSLTTDAMYYILGFVNQQKLECVTCGKYIKWIIAEK